MRAPFQNVPIANYDDQISVADGGQTVGDHKRSPPRQEFGQSLLYLLLGQGIHMGGRFIKDQDPGIGDEGPGK